MTKLGEVQHTDRGFEYIDFADANGEPCSLQQSSAIGEDNLDVPGSSFVWLGCKNNSDETSPRMHLNRDQVDALQTHLVNWWNTGSFAEEA